MPITLNHSNIGVQYSTGSNYIIETVKSDLYRRNEIYDSIVRDNIQVAPVTPSIYIENGTNNVYAVESYTYSGTANTADFTRVFTKSTTCDILVVGGGGAGGNSIGGGGGAGGVVYTVNQTLNVGTYTFKIGRGGIGTIHPGGDGQGTVGIDQDGQDSFIQLNSTDVMFPMGGVNQSLRGKGGGGGGVYYSAITGNGRNGGSGGGAAERENAIYNGGSSTQGNTLWNGTSYVAGGSAGNGNLTSDGNYYAAGGGGAGNTLFNNSIYNGKTGVQINITGASQFYAAGGGGGQLTSNDLTRGLGGSGIGGDGRVRNSNNTAYLREVTNGTNGTGSGGGGGAYEAAPLTAAGSGGSGIVIIRYLLGTIQANNFLTNEPTVSPSITSDIIIESYTYSGSANTMSYSKTFAINTVCDILIVAGGGAGGASAGGGGGAGGLIYLTNQEILAGTYNITVGKGGNVSSGNGNNSSFGTFVAIGGGGGSSMDSTPGNGGSGGGGNRVPGAVASTAVAGQTGGTGTANQGNNGGTGKNNGGHDAAGGGGGGAGAAGDSAFAVGRGANGGIGRAIDITGTSVFYAGGGGGGSGSNFSSAGSGGSGGGGNGATWANTGSNGTNGLGGGGGGGSAYPGDGRHGGAGGSGIVIIRYRSLAQPPVSINMNKTLNINYYPTLSPIIYTLNFPKTTVVTINNGGDKLLNGTYTLTLSSNISTLVPIQNQSLQDTKIASSNISLRYHLLNPVIDPIGAQWTYSSSNTSVYHMGSVGIGTTSPEYQLDVRGTIYSSTGGFTSSTLTKWSVLSDRRIKENIVKASYEKCLENVKNIELYNFNFKDNCVNTNDRHQLGFIAQEVQQVYPKAVEVGKMIVNLEQKIDDLLTLNITQIDYTLYGAVKSLIEKIENIKIKMEHIKTTYDIP